MADWNDLTEIWPNQDNVTRLGTICVHGRLCQQDLVQEIKMSLGTILVIILILILVGVLPTWGHSRDWGYFPSGGLGLVLLVVLVLVLMGRI